MGGISTVGVVLVSGYVYVGYKDKIDFAFVAAGIIAKKVWKEFLYGVEVTCYFILDHIPGTDDEDYTPKNKTNKNNKKSEVIEVVEVDEKERKKYELYL